VLTATLASPWCLPCAAATVTPPAVAGAVNRPSAVIAPAVVDQVIVGAVASGLPNWSNPVAVNCCLWPRSSETLSGLTVIVSSVCFTVTLTLLWTDNPAGSVMVAVKV
jgi:hypothetical protein